MFQILLSAALPLFVLLAIAGSPDTSGHTLLPRDDPVPATNTSALPPGWPAGEGFCWEGGSPEDPILLGAAFNDPKGMTIESCIAYCDEKKYRMAGLQAGYQCYCGQIHNPDAPFESEGYVLCMDQCAGNAAEYCGGDESIVLFMKDDGLDPLVGPATLTSGPWRFSWFYNDTVGARALRHNAVDLHPPLRRGNLTIAACVNACGNAGYLLAGVEYADECYCGNELENFSQPVPGYIPLDGPMECTGDSEICGGPDLLSVYTLPGSGLVPVIPFGSKYDGF